MNLHRHAAEISPAAMVAESTVYIAASAATVVVGALALALYRQQFTGFGKKKEKALTPQEMEIQKLHETEEMLVKKQEFLEKKIEQEIATARKHDSAA